MGRARQLRNDGLWTNHGEQLELGKNVIETDVIFDKQMTLFFVLTFLLIEHNCALAIRRGNIARAHATMHSFITVCALVASCFRSGHPTRLQVAEAC